MAVRLRLRRLGRKKRPFYRIIAADSRAPRNGRFIEEIGYYNPLTHPPTVNVNEERAMHWLNVGATPSKTVQNILSRKGIILKFDLKKRGVSEEKINEELRKWEVLQIERNRRLEAEKESGKQRRKKAKAAQAKEAGAEVAAASTAQAAETSQATTPPDSSESPAAETKEENK